MDAIYCAIAGLGVGYVSNLLNKEGTFLRLAGGMILIAMGIKIFFTHPSETAP
jgi:cytochrome c biogenesis protein CcdA